MTGYVGRYAPSPTGDLHLGNALAAVAAVARARRAGGRIGLRMEDLDTPRVIDGAAARIEEDLRALGLSFDGPTLVQSADLSRYHAALAQLRAQGLLYACKCSRKELERLASAPHAGEEGPVYTGTCRALALPFDDPALPVSWRVRVPAREVRVLDRLQGPVAQELVRDVGDFVVKRKDGMIAYQLAVVVDDAFQGVTEVVRGRDLLSSAPRQAFLFEALGHPIPAFAHLPLWVDERGHRLSKRSGDSPTILRELFSRGVSGPQVLARIARALGVDGGADALSFEALSARLDDAVLARPTVGP
jgi:glutamyl-Q tRNA(Asp) synthetase